jgi:hypothetical protein
MSQGFSPMNPPMTTGQKTDYVPNFVPQLAPVPPVQGLQSFSRSPSAPMYTVSPMQYPMQVPAGYTAVVMNPSPLLLAPMMPGSSNSLPRGCPQMQYTLSGAATCSETVSPAGPGPHPGLFISTSTVPTPDWKSMQHLTKNQLSHAAYSQSNSRSVSVSSDRDLPVLEQERERTPSMHSLPRLSSGPMMCYSNSSSRSNSVSSVRSASPSETTIPKRQLIDNCRAHFNSMPIPYDEIGNRGENVVRIKVKTRNALENIVPFIDACNAQNLLTRVSCPISTKKGRQHIRGFLAYLECSDSSAVQQLFNEYNEKFACFKPLDVNPPSKRPYNPAAANVGAMGN